MKIRCVPRLLVIGLVATMAACATYPVNPPLTQYDENYGYRQVNALPGPQNSDETFVLVGLSGGGTRAAALDYGVLKFLDSVRFGADQRSLLDEVDAISTSSGASLPAAYFGLYGKDRFLEKFDDDVLYVPLQSGLARNLLNPLNWPRLMSATFSRSDLAAEYLDKHIFGGATYADMQSARPLIVLNATDMGIGSQFPFTQSMFDALCSDLSAFPISRAVTASMAFTPAFTPVALRNYGGDACGFRTPDWAHNALRQGVEDNAMLYVRAKDLLSYGDTEHRPYIHLLDSGIADNMGIRIAALPFLVRDTPWSQMDRLLDGTIRRLVVILVDAKPKGHFEGDLQPKPPSLATSIATSATKPLANYSYETIEMIRGGMKDMQGILDDYRNRRRQCDTVANKSCEELSDNKDCHNTLVNACFEEFSVTEEFRPPDVKLYLLHVSFESIKEQARREKFQGIPTALQLPRDTVDELIGIAPELLRAIPDFHRLVNELSQMEQ